MNVNPLTYYVLILVISQIIIYKFWYEKRILSLSKSRFIRIFWSLIILTVPLLGALLFSFYPNDDFRVLVDDVHSEFDMHLKNIIVTALFSVFTYFLFIVYYYNFHVDYFSYLIIISYSVIILIIFFRAHLNERIKKILPIVFLVLVNVIHYWSINDNYAFIVLIAAAIIILEYPIAYSKIFFLIPLFVYWYYLAMKLYLQKRS